MVSSSRLTGKRGPGHGLPLWRGSHLLMFAVVSRVCEGTRNSSGWQESHVSIKAKSEPAAARAIWRTPAVTQRGAAPGCVAGARRAWQRRNARRASATPRVETCKRHGMGATQPSGMDARRSAALGQNQVRAMYMTWQRMVVRVHSDSIAWAVNARGRRLRAHAARRPTVWDQRSQ